MSNNIYVITKGLHYGKLVRIAATATKGYRYVNEVESSEPLGCVCIDDLTEVGCVTPDMWSAEFICREGVRRTAEVLLEQQAAEAITLARMS